jgi:hypothetical protein
LGLALALRVVEVAGGQIGVESIVGAGSDFRCRWPINIGEILSPSSSHEINATVVVVSERTTLAQSLLCTASTYAWETLEQAHDFVQATQLKDAYDGPGPLIFFLDELLLHADPLAAKTFLSRTSLNIGMSPSMGSSPAPTYAIAVATDPHIVSRDFRFHGVVSPPFHRTQVLSAVTDVLNKRRRPSIEPPDLPQVVDGEPFPRGRLVRSRPPLQTSGPR